VTDRDKDTNRDRDRQRQGKWQRRRHTNRHGHRYRQEKSIQKRYAEGKKARIECKQEGGREREREREREKRERETEARTHRRHMQTHFSCLLLPVFFSPAALSPSHTNTHHLENKNNKIESLRTRAMFNTGLLKL